MIQIFTDYILENETKECSHCVVGMAHTEVRVAHTVSRQHGSHCCCMLTLRSPSVGMLTPCRQHGSHCGRQKAVSNGEAGLATSQMERSPGRRACLCREEPREESVLCGEEPREEMSHCSRRAWWERV